MFLRISGLCWGLVMQYLKKTRGQRNRDRRHKKQMSVYCPFGKHKGKAWELVPTLYLEWCIDTFDKGTDYGLLVRLIMQVRRAKSEVDDRQRIAAYRQRLAEKAKTRRKSPV